MEVSCQSFWVCENKNKNRNCLRYDIKYDLFKTEEEMNKNKKQKVI